jgi:putative acetyltransferase
MDIRIDDLQGRAIQALLQTHLDAMYEHSPPESVHALDLAALRHTSMTFWTAWDSDELLGCGALKQLSATHVQKGVARAILRHIEAAARAKGIQRISLETGPHAPFWAAQKLYVSEGFVECNPFADYALDPYSMFMTKPLADESTRV